MSIGLWINGMQRNDDSQKNKRWESKKNGCIEMQLKRSLIAAGNPSS
jgi:hypothetical protein